MTGQKRIVDHANAIAAMKNKKKISKRKRLTASRKRRRQ